MRPLRFIGCLLLVTVIAPGCFVSARPKQTVMVFAAASVTDAFEQIRKVFESETGVVVKVNYAGSSTLAKQILSGAKPDLFISANEAWVDAIDEMGDVAKRVELLGNELVLIVNRDAEIRPSKVSEMLHEKVKRISIADPESVPAGIYAKQAITELGQWAQVESRILIGADVRHALAHVQSGGAQVGIVYATDAAISDAVAVTGKIDCSLTDPIVYPLVMTPTGVGNADVQDLFEFVQSDRAAAIFRKYGFVTHKVEP